MLCPACAIPLSDEAQRCPSCDGPALLDGRFRLDGVLGQGAAGVTWRAVRCSDGKAFAIKELLVRRLDEAKTWELFDRECAVLSQLDHPGIPAFEERFTAGHGRSAGAYLVHELVEGETLARELKHHRYSLLEALDVLAEVLGILAYLQSLHPPVVHRDLKPENLVRRAADGRLMLIDFGSVREALTPSSEAGSTLAGTWGFMPPEQLRGQAGPATDIYAAGCLTLSLLARCPIHELLDHELRLRWQPAVQVPRPVQRLLERMLAADPGRRPTDARALAEEVRRLKLARPRTGTVRRAAQFAVGFAALLLAAGLLASGTPSPAPPAAAVALAAAPAPPVATFRPPVPDNAAMVAAMRAKFFPPPGPPPVLEAGTSACAARGDCLALREGFLGVKIPEACERLAKRFDDPSTVILGERATFDLTIDGERATCQQELVQGLFCSVSCLLRYRDISLAAFQDKAKSVAQFVRDRHGREMHSSAMSAEQLYWSWSDGADRSLSVKAEYYHGGGEGRPCDIHVMLSGNMRSGGGGQTSVSKAGSKAKM